MKATLTALLLLTCATSLYAASSSPPDVTGPLNPNPGNPPDHLRVVLFENGNTDINTDSGNEMTNWEQADDFEVGAGATVTGCEFDFLFTGGGFWDGTIEWVLYLDAGGSPGAVHCSGNGVNTVQTALGSAQGFDWYNLQFDLDAPCGIDPNVRYWLGLHASADCTTRDNMYWAYSQNQQFSFSQEAFECTPPWATVSIEDRAFSLLGDQATPVEASSWGHIKSIYQD